MFVCTLPPVAIVVPMLFVVMGMLGMGNGAVFQIAPQRFPPTSKSSRESLVPLEASVASFCPRFSEC